MAYTTIDDPTQYFQTAIWTGTGSSQTITNDGNSDLKPDWIWIKCRSNSRDHVLLDSTRGGTKALTSNTTGAEATDGAITSFNTDGFTHSGQNAYGGNGETHVGWQWAANGGTTSSNTDGTITATVQANTTAGFSIVTYTGTGSNATVGHGLGKAPNLVIVKLRSGVGSWAVYNRAVGATKVAYLENTSGFFVSGGNSFWNDTNPTSSVFTVGNEATVNTSSGTHVAYCFAEIQGYSKFGSYTGNGSTDGPFVHTGFRPAWLMIKNADATGLWMMYDSVRSTFNTIDKEIYANTSDVDATVDRGDLLSNGFKIRATSTSLNTSGQKYIFISFAEHPFVSSEGVPVTAR